MIRAIAQEQECINIPDTCTYYLYKCETTLFHCPLDIVEGMARITEARLRRDVSEGKIVDFQRSNGGFEVIRREALNGHESKVRAQLCKYRWYCLELAIRYTTFHIHSRYWISAVFIESLSLP